MKVLKAIIWVQGIYTLITAVWPIIHVDSFMEVTGPKTDVWLVKTVGALLIPLAACLMSYLFIETDRRPAFILGTLSCVAFISIDFYYALKDIIPNIYMADGVLQILFLSTWLFIRTRHYDVLVRR